jgi:acetyl esterase/lipase
MRAPLSGRDAAWVTYSTPDTPGTLPVILYMHGGGMTATLALMAASMTAGLHIYSRHARRKR